jgi:hypothetical protein
LRDFVLRCLLATPVAVNLDRVRAPTCVLSALALNSVVRGQ